MTDWPATLRICQRELHKGRCCLGLNAKAHGWCSVDRHKDQWIECGMEPPDKEGESMKGEILPPAGAALAELLAPVEDDTMLAWPDFERECTTRAQVGWRMGVTGFVITGRALSDYRRRAGAGQWGAWLEQTLPISLQTAARLMRIGRDPNIGRHAETVNLVNGPLPSDQLILDEICGMGPEEFDGLVEQGVIHAEMRRGDLKRHLVETRHGGGQAEPPPLPDGQYGVILADPPWEFRTWSDAGKGRSPDMHYPTKSMAELMSMGPDVKAAAADDCHLFLWVGAGPRRDYEFLIEAWGFEPKGEAFVWTKGGALGLGYTVRYQHETCLRGTRGSPKTLNKDVGTWIDAPRREHSRKPDEVYQRIERLVAGPYLELFARPLERRPDWTYWGNDPALKEETA
ncbi:MAG: hypothetical protein F4X35_05160 [Alphaproteobacteria bacterium]|nr:hypothetical protein [Alphaproteobacteria bacterium]